MKKLCISQQQTCHSTPATSALIFATRVQHNMNRANRIEIICLLENDYFLNMYLFLVVLV